VNKSELIDAVARHADISKAAAGRAVDAMVNSIKESLRNGDMVTLVGSARSTSASARPAAAATRGPAKPSTSARRRSRSSGLARN
jgi:nucleoid DNA-binding protein